MGELGPIHLFTTGSKTFNEMNEASTVTNETGSGRDST